DRTWMIPASTASCSADASDDLAATVALRALPAVEATAALALRANVFARTGRSTRRFVTGIGLCVRGSRAHLVLCIVPRHELASFFTLVNASARMWLLPWLEWRVAQDQRPRAAGIRTRACRASERAPLSRYSASSEMSRAARCWPRKC